MAVDQLRQDLRHAFRSLLRAPAFSVVTILTLALGIGANTAIFSIVNGVILRPLGYPKPEQLMYLTTRFPAFGFDQFWVSPPEYFEYRELNQSFSAVGAFTTGEVNLTAGDRPLRARSASVDDSLLAGAWRAAGAGTAVQQGRSRSDRPTSHARGAAGTAAALCDPLARALADRVRWPNDPRADGGGERSAARGDRDHAARRGRDGQPHRDLAAARPQSRRIARTVAAISSI